MLLCFVDESNKGTFFGFAAILADANTTYSLTEELNDLMAQFEDTYRVARNTEIHAYPLFHGKDEWAGVGARARVAIYTDIIEAILKASVTILMRSVDAERLRRRQEREHYPERFPPEQVCFQHILQRADCLARQSGTYALIIADDRSDRERHRERFATYRTVGTPGVYMHTRLRNLLDTVHFAPSHHSRMLQAADMLAFTYRRRATIMEPDGRAEATMASLWAKIEASSKVHDAGSWP